MKKYVCTICGYVYDEAKGMPEAGILIGTKWDALPPQLDLPYLRGKQGTVRGTGYSRTC